MYGRYKDPVPPERGTPVSAKQTLLDAERTRKRSLKRIGSNVQLALSFPLAVQRPNTSENGLKRVSSRETGMTITPRPPTAPAPVNVNGNGNDGDSTEVPTPQSTVSSRRRLIRQPTVLDISPTKKSERRGSRSGRRKSSAGSDLNLNLLSQERPTTSGVDPSQSRGDPERPSLILPSDVPDSKRPSTTSGTGQRHSLGDGAGGSGASANASASPSPAAANASTFGSAVSKSPGSPGLTAFSGLGGNLGGVRGGFNAGFKGMTGRTGFQGWTQLALQGDIDQAVTGQKQTMVAYKDAAKILLATDGFSADDDEGGMKGIEEEPGIDGEGHGGGYIDDAKPKSSHWQKLANVIGAVGAARSCGMDLSMTVPTPGTALLGRRGSGLWGHGGSLVDDAAEVVADDFGVKVSPANSSRRVSDAAIDESGDGVAELRASSAASGAQSTAALGVRPSTSESHASSTSTGSGTQGTTGGGGAGPKFMTTAQRKEAKRRQALGLKQKELGVVSHGPFQWLLTIPKHRENHEARLARRKKARQSGDSQQGKSLAERFPGSDHGGLVGDRADWDTCCPVPSKPVIDEDWGTRMLQEPELEPLSQQFFRSTEKVDRLFVRGGFQSTEASKVFLTQTKVEGQGSILTPTPKAPTVYHSAGVDIESVQKIRPSVPDAPTVHSAGVSSASAFGVDSEATAAEIPATPGMRSRADTTRASPEPTHAKEIPLVIPVKIGHDHIPVTRVGDSLRPVPSLSTMSRLREDLEKQDTTDTRIPQSGDRMLHKKLRDDRSLFLDRVRGSYTDESRDARLTLIDKRPPSPCSIYIAECNGDNNHPGAIPESAAVVTRGDGIVNLQQRNLSAKGAKALADSLKVGPRVNILNVVGCGLTADGVVMLGEVVGGFKFAKGESMARIDLSNNPLLGRRGPEAGGGLVKLFDRVREINIENCMVGDVGIAMLVESLLGNHYLKSVCLAKNKIGRKSAELIGEFLYINDSVDKMDLSWNNLRTEACDFIVAGLRENAFLKELNLAWNCFGNAKSGDQWGGLIENHDSIAHLDLSNNHFTERNLLILSECAPHAHNLKTLVVGGHSYGELCRTSLENLLRAFTKQKKNLEVSRCVVDGIDLHEVKHKVQVRESMLAPLTSPRHSGFHSASPSADLQTYGIDETRPGTGYVIPSTASAPIIDPLNLDGMYTLDLEVPYDRAVARYLYRLACTKRWKVMKQERMDGKKINILEAGQYHVPKEGELQFSFALMKGGSDELFRKRGFHPMRPLCAYDDKADRYDLLNKAVADAITNAPDNWAQILTDDIIYLLDEFGLQNKNKVETMGSVCAESVEQMDACYFSHNSSEDDVLIDAKRAVSSLFYFSRDNPTGFYSLDLANSVERRLARELWDMHRAEQFVRTEKCLPCTSETKESPAWRHVVYDDDPWVVPTEWDKFPEDGVIEFDYVSTVRPSLKERRDGMMKIADWKRFWTFITHPAVGDWGRVILLRHKLALEGRYINVKYAGDIIETFTDSDAKVEGALALWGRMDTLEHYLNMIHQKLSFAEFQTVVLRIGILNLWHPEITVDGISFIADTTTFDGAEAVRLFTQLALIETGSTFGECKLDGRRFDFKPRLKETPEVLTVEAEDDDLATAGSVAAMSLTTGDSQRLDFPTPKVTVNPAVEKARLARVEKERIEREAQEAEEQREFEEARMKQMEKMKGWVTIVYASSVHDDVARRDAFLETIHFVGAAKHLRTRRKDPKTGEMTLEPMPLVPDDLANVINFMDVAKAIGKYRANDAPAWLGPPRVGGASDESPMIKRQRLMQARLAATRSMGNAMIGISRAQKMGSGWLANARKKMQEADQEEARKEAAKSPKALKHVPSFRKMPSVSSVLAMAAKKASGTATPPSQVMPAKTKATLKKMGSQLQGADGGFAWPEPRRGGVSRQSSRLSLSRQTSKATLETTPETPTIPPTPPKRPLIQLNGPPKSKQTPLPAATDTAKNSGNIDGSESATVSTASGISDVSAVVVPPTPPSVSQRTRTPHRPPSLRSVVSLS